MKQCLFALFGAFFLFSCTSVQDKQTGTRDSRERGVSQDIEERNYDEIDVTQIETTTDIQKTEAIAVLLPFSAPAKSFLHTISNAIRVGLLYRLYETKSSLQVYFIDTYKRDMADVQEEIKNLDIGMILGPLLPRQVHALANIYSGDVPVVAFNRTEVTQDNWYSFSLSLSDETRQAALDIAYAEYKTAFVLYANTTWARKAADAFIKEWTEQGGDFGNVGVLQSDVSLAKTVSQLVGITNKDVQTYSRYLRKKQIAQRKAAKDKKTTFVDPIDNLEPEERTQFIESVSRKYPGDFVYLIADAQQSRQLKPLLSFYLSNDLQIFATSKTYGSNISKQAQRDLNGILFTDAPWVTDVQYAQVRAYLHEQWSHIHPIYDRFYALGYDILSVVRLLDAHARDDEQGFFINGATGVLFINDEDYLSRQATWHKILLNGTASVEEIPAYQPPPLQWETPTNTKVRTIPVKSKKINEQL